MNKKLAIISNWKFKDPTFNSIKAISESMIVVSSKSSISLYDFDTYCEEPTITQLKNKSKGENLSVQRLNFRQLLTFSKNGELTIWTKQNKTWVGIEFIFVQCIHQLSV